MTSLSVVYFALLLHEPLVHRFERDQERGLALGPAPSRPGAGGARPISTWQVRYDYEADADASATSDYRENFYREEVPTKAKKPVEASAAGREAFQKRKAALAAAAKEEARQAELSQARRAAPRNLEETRRRVRRRGARM